MGRVLGLLLSLTIAAIARADAAELAIAARDQDGAAAVDAVISVWPADGRALPSANNQPHVIDQRDEAFIPFVTIMRRGDTLSFKNSDRTRHHVYSFSPLKQFEMVLNPGEKSQALRFEQSGVAAIGCNIHDKMIAYAFVTDTPWVAQTDAEGRATVTGLPKGKYRAEVWHPRMDMDSGTVEKTFAIDSHGELTFALHLNPPRAGGPHDRHY